jgi:Yip1 domain
MTGSSPVAGQRSLIDRVKGILIQPNAEWALIDTEPATVGSLFTRYAVLLAAIPAIAGAIGFARFSAGWAIRFAIVEYVASLISVYVLALIIDALAPQFGGQRSQVQALKVAVYSSTAGWVFGVFAIIPLLSVLGLLGALYSLYLLFVGLPLLMKPPADRATGYTVVTILCAIVVWVLVGYVAGLVGGTGGFGSRFT